MHLNLLKALTNRLANLVAANAEHGGPVIPGCAAGGVQDIPEFAEAASWGFLCAAHGGPLPACTPLERGARLQLLQCSGTRVPGCAWAPLLPTGVPERKQPAPRPLRCNSVCVSCHRSTAALVRAPPSPPSCFFFWFLVRAMTFSEHGAPASLNSK